MIFVLKMQLRVQMIRIVLIIEHIVVSDSAGYIQDCSQLCLTIKITLRLTLY